MLVAHKVIDAMLGLSNKYKRMDVPGVGREQLIRIAETIMDAEKFDFGALMLEKLSAEDAPKGAWKAPSLTEDEQDFWHQGLIPLPAPTCWYEYTLGECVTGLLVHNEPDSPDWYAERVDFIPKQNLMLVDAVQVKVTRFKEWRIMAPEKLQMMAGGNDVFLQQMQNSKTFMEMNVDAIIPMALYLTLMLNSKSTETSPARIDEPVNKKRRRKGLTPLPEHRIVRIVPERYQYERNPDGTLSDRRSPKLHWRRSHQRHLASGQIVVVVRTLVGRAENGTVSHEYRIIHSVDEEK